MSLKTPLREARTRRTCAAIRAAAFALAQDKGYDATTFDDVAALAGVSRRTVFNHVSCKADLFLEFPLTPDDEAVATFTTGTGPLLADLTRLVSDGVRTTEADGELASLRRARVRQLLTLMRQSPELKQALHLKMRAFTELLHEAVARRLDLPRTDPQVRAVAHLGTALQRAAIDRWIETDDDTLLLSTTVSDAGAALAQVLGLPEP
ncbi:TetR/AcrR family transcriptional regulator [Actinomyces trachealis]|uniref:TetR/AcrR family transcriptional regulator n=1 Tax=Actinomyces trachealis TaxID=2763540 RepID=UPI001892BF89|nr:TetR family transcriptional regulator [Actinomyces trachealis]